MEKSCAVTLQMKLSESNDYTLSISFIKTHHTSQSQRNLWSPQFGMGVLQWICRMFSEYLFFPKNTSLEGCFWKLYLSKQYFLGIQKVPSNFLKKTTKKSFNFEILTELQENRLYKFWTAGYALSCVVSCLRFRFLCNNWLPYHW